MNKFGMRVTEDTYWASKVQDTDVNNNTESDNLFELTGSVLVKRIFGIVTDTIGAADCDTLYLNLFSNAHTTAITLAGGVDIKGAGIGSLILKRGAVGVALTLVNVAATNGFSEAADADDNDLAFREFVVVQETGQDTYIRSTYTSTMAPCTGEITWCVEYIPLGAGSSLVAV